MSSTDLLSFILGTVRISKSKSYSYGIQRFLSKETLCLPTRRFSFAMTSSKHHWLGFVSDSGICLGLASSMLSTFSIIANSDSVTHVQDTRERIPPLSPYKMEDSILSSHQRPVDRESYWHCWCQIRGRTLQASRMSLSIRGSHDVHPCLTGAFPTVGTCWASISPPNNESLWKEPS